MWQRLATSQTKSVADNAAGATILPRVAMAIRDTLGAHPNGLGGKSLSVHCLGDRSAIQIGALTHRNGSVLSVCPNVRARQLSSYPDPEFGQEGSGSFLCVPSQNGRPLVCLQPQSQSFCASEMVKREGVNYEPLCEPSQNGWRLERPQAHHQ